MVLFTDRLSYISSNKIHEWLFDGFLSQFACKYGQGEAFPKERGGADA